MAKIKVNPAPLAYKAAGKGTPVVLIHGHPFDHTMWAPQIAALSNSYQVIAPDLRGYGKSALTGTSAVAFEDYAADVLQLLDQLKIDSFHLGGLSMGGQIIMEMFRQSPNRIKSLIFADTFAGLDTPEARQARNVAATKLENEGMAGYADEVIGKMITPAHVKSQPAVAAHVLKMMKSTSPLAAATAMRARSERIDYLNIVLPEIDIPTLVIVGREDEFTPVARAEELQSHLQNCKLVVIDNAGHMPNLEQPEQFNKVVFDFLDSLDYSKSSF